ncbi:Hypothetical protein D9617_56g096160 [Elsinoe fawcettii]|nr:Hypothetical protein D9617_56g096160 [Elsinoe fawcettii]
MIERHILPKGGDKSAVGIADPRKYKTADYVAKLDSVEAKITNWKDVTYLRKQGFSRDIIKQIILHTNEHGILQRGPMPQGSIAVGANIKGAERASSSRRKIAAAEHERAGKRHKNGQIQGEKQEQRTKKRRKTELEPARGKKKKKLQDNVRQQKKTGNRKAQEDSEDCQTQYNAGARRERPAGKRQRVISGDDEKNAPDTPPDTDVGDCRDRTQEDTVQEEYSPTLVPERIQTDEEGEETGQDLLAASRAIDTAGGADSTTEEPDVTAIGTNDAVGGENIVSLGADLESQASTTHDTTERGKDFQSSIGVATSTGHDTPKYDIEFGKRIEKEYLRRIGSLREYLLQDLTTRNSELTKTQLAWLEKAEIVPRVSGLESSTARDVSNDTIWVLSIGAYRHAVKSAHKLPPCFILRQPFADAGEWQNQRRMADFARMIRTTYSGQMFSVKKASSQHASEMDAARFADLLQAPSPGYNALDLGDLVRSDEPLFTRWAELALLRSLIDSRARGSKSEKSKYQDLLSCLGFNLVGTYAPFSGAHVDALSGK